MIEQNPEVPNSKRRTLGELIQTYRTDPVSTFHKLRFHVRKNQETLLKRLAASHGHFELNAIRAREIRLWHMDWLGGGKTAMAHSFMSQLRTLCRFGLTMLEDPECERLCVVLNKLRFAAPLPRTDYLTADQVVAVRSTAHYWFGWDTIALANAFQYEVILRQKDVIGEWVPLDEPGESNVTHQGEKWLRGITWQEIDENLILRHITSKRQKPIEFDLKLAPMVMEELKLEFPESVRADPDTGEEVIDRQELPARGPVILNNITGLPFRAAEFRRKWRLVATKAGVPKTVRNMDSRAGGITEATEAGIPIEHIKHAATHADINQTQKYARGATGKVASTIIGRVAHRRRTSGGS
jgi:hypothetical protein